jgi:hypothetical protein
VANDLSFAGRTCSADRTRKLPQRPSRIGKNAYFDAQKYGAADPKVAAAVQPFEDPPSGCRLLPLPWFVCPGVIRKTTSGSKEETSHDS